ncbi:MAG: class II fructose-bisphosphate aldolase [Lentisphaeria bacterium]|jgi:ketose-bisphosphate aldolase|nr:class II fructose-bisphosphate aldolase [Lentisphaeria bacterium]
MALVTMKEMLLAARKEKRAVGAFNIANYETARAVLMAAEGEKQPVIIQLYMRLFDSEKAYDLAGLLIRLANRADIPVAIHLDHGNTVKQVKDALAWGYTSVMYDGSRLSFEENVKNTAFCVQYAKSFGASVEGEIGHVAQGDETAITEVSEAVEFAGATGVDALAVSIGTAHGYYTSEPKLDIERCRAIAEALPELPLVLHGGSGTPLSDVRKVIENGVAKVNIATEYMDTYLKSSRKELEKLNGKFLPIDKYFDPIVDECAAHAARLIRFFAGK